MEEEKSGQTLNEIRDSKRTSKQIFPVPVELEGIIYHPVYLMLDHEKIKDLVARPFPNGNITLCFLNEKSITFYDDQLNEIKTDSSFIVGVHSLEKKYFLNIASKLEAIIINLKPGSFRRLFNQSSSTVENRFADLIDFIPPEAEKHIKSIFVIKNIDEKLNVIMEFLQILLNQKIKEKDGFYHKALDLITESKCKITVNDLSNKLSASKRNFERSFHVNVGIAPKEYIRIQRMNFVFDYLLKSNFVDWLEIIYDFGFYDQSHFIHEFKLVTGLTPSEFHNLQKSRMIFTNRYYMIQNKELFKNDFNSGNII